MLNTLSDNVIHLPGSDNQARSQTDSIFELAGTLGIEDLHFKYDPATGLKAIIAIHNTSRGSALGGTRCMPYASENEAINDAMRLAHGMSYKSAFANLPYGGGKAVLMRPQSIPDPDAYFESYGDFIETFMGRFITAVDVGTSVEDMDRIARRSNYVLSTSSNQGDPSYDTAKGVLYGIKAAAKVCLQRTDLKDLRIAIQGVGKVGFHLAKLLDHEGVKLIVSDINLKSAQRCAESFNAKIVSPDQIYSTICDVFSPCALGSSINTKTINLINTKVICGSANNQLASDKVGDMLYQKQIFFAPDYVVNVGGLIHVVFDSKIRAGTKVAEIYDAVIDIYQRTQKHNQPSHRIANQIVEQILGNSNKASLASDSIRSMT